MKVELYHTTSELKKLFRKEKNPRIAVHIRAVYPALMDKTTPQIGDLLGYSRRTIQNWIYAYNRKGIQGLKESGGRGNKSKLNKDQIQMIWDQAGFHTSKNVRLPDNVTLIPLPPYSPQLNPIEKLWQYLRKHYRSNRVYTDYDALRIATIDAWQKTCLDKKKIKSI